MQRYDEIKVPFMESIFLGNGMGTEFQGPINYEMMAIPTVH